MKYIAFFIACLFVVTGCTDDPDAALLDMIQGTWLNQEQEIVSNPEYKRVFDGSRYEVYKWSSALSDFEIVEEGIFSISEGILTEYAGMIRDSSGTYRALADGDYEIFEHHSFYLSTDIFSTIACEGTATTLIGEWTSIGPEKYHKKNGDRTYLADEYGTIRRVFTPDTYTRNNDNYFEYNPDGSVASSAKPPFQYTNVQYNGEDWSGEDGDGDTWHLRSIVVPGAASDGSNLLLFQYFRRE